MKKIVLLITTICLTSETYGQKTSSSSVDEYECIYEYQMKNDKGFFLCHFYHSSNWQKLSYVL